MMISKKMNKQLNEQITNEFHAAHLYLDMACALMDEGLKILSAWFRHHAAEEREHGTKILDYVHEVGGKVKLQAIAAPGARPKTIQGMVEAALDHEWKVTKQIHALVALADQEKDYATRSFLQWFVDEQVEEVAVVTELLDVIRLSGGKNWLQVEARMAKAMKEGS